MLFLICHRVSSTETRQTYIVQLKKLRTASSFDDHAQLYTSTLASVSPRAQLQYMYKHVFTGFSATLTVLEAQALWARDEVISVHPEAIYQLHTTRTPHFLGLEKHMDKLPKPDAVSKVIIGVLDTGIWPKSQSFNDSGYGPVDETRWSGACEENMCNKKLVGARHFSKGYEAALHASGLKMEDLGEVRSPVDIDGHGTHTASTAGGSAVPKASLFGYAHGTARGMAANARIAAYKCCWKVGCISTDILAAMDQAIEDKVDVLSLSLGGSPATPYYNSTIAIGAFAAMQAGILVSCSAGNSGPSPYSVSNTAPWILTVGAGTLDREFPAPISLGNGKTYKGVSLYSDPQSPKGKKHPIVYAANATNNATGGAMCLAGTLIPKMVEGKIVVCDRGGSARAEKGSVVKAAGGVGMVLANTALYGDDLIADAHVLPATAVTIKAGNHIKAYLYSASEPTATIAFEGTKLGVKPSPVVAAFSSRGPNMLAPWILKPDLIGPGVNILAAWTPKAGPSGLPTDERRVDFNIISGTSMSCPHVSGLAALLKAAHSDWSPAAIRSALMTTAYSAYKNDDGKTIIDTATGNTSNPFAIGAGYVDPTSALDPGLVYDLCPLDYFNFLCAMNYDSAQIASLAQGKSDFTCDKKKTYNVNDLNYPSFAVPVGANETGRPIVVKYSRTLTNVGEPGTYKVSLFSPSKSVKISVVPGILSFSRKEKKSYTVIFKVATKVQSNTNQFGRIQWSDGKHVVGSPVAFSWT